MQHNIKTIYIHQVMQILANVWPSKLQKKNTQQDEVTKRAPVKPQMTENNVENVMEIWKH